MCFCVDFDNGRVIKEININILFGELRCGEIGRKFENVFV